MGMLMSDKVFVRAMVSVGLVLPVSFFDIGGADIPIAVFVLAIGWLLLLSGSGTIDTCLMFVFLGLVIGFAGILIQTMLGHNLRGYHPFLSFMFFSLPLGGYFLGKSYFGREANLMQYFRVVSCMVSVFSIVLGGAILADGGDVKVYVTSEAGQLAYFNSGVFHGFLYAAKGVNSLSATLSFLFLIVFSCFLFDNRTPFLKFVNFVGAFVLFLLVIFSGSRGATLGLFLGGGVIMYFRMGLIGNVMDRCVAKGLFFFCFFVAVVLLGVVDTRIKNTVELLLSGEYVEASTNRLLIMGDVLRDLCAHPFLGISFGASGEGLSSSNSSAHNQFLTTLWKIGPLGGVFYMLGFIGLVFKVFKIVSRGDNFMFKAYLSGMITLVFVESLFWDVLMIPIVGGGFFVVLGALASDRKRAGRGIPSKAYI